MAWKIPMGRKEMLRGKPLETVKLQILDRIMWNAAA
jgi:hypothetical protein